MAGHSKWANTKHRKDRADKKKGKIFSRIMKEVISAVKQGGTDPKSNSKLRIAIQKAKDANLPNDNIERYIKKASSSDTQDYANLTYELYGFGGVGIIVDIMTDNKNRIASDIRIAINKCGGTIATPGAVAYNFDRKGLFKVPKEGANEEELFLFATENGAEDFASDEDDFVITTSVEGFAGMKEVLEQKGIKIIDAQLAMVPKIYVQVNDQLADENITLIEWLEDIDDVDAVYHNMQM